MNPARIAVVGAGPSGIALIERLVANVADLAPRRRVEIHVIDPFPVGRGRVWRPDVSSLLWMNSMAEDVTMFTDESVTCDGPVVPGPPLDEWAHAVRPDELDDPSLATELASLTALSFPTRRVQSEYLAWSYRRLSATLPSTVRLVEHAATVLDVTDEGATQLVRLDDGDELVVDVVVLTLGHLDAEPDAPRAPLATFATRHGARYVPPSHTADLDLDDLGAGEPVIVRGFGLAFVDLMVLLSEGRGGRFTSGPSGVRYVASGDEPILHVGSRRGVPYRSKITYRLGAPRAAVPRFFDGAAIDGLLARHDRLEFWPHVWPLLAKDAAWAYYHELFHAHGERTSGAWSTFDDRYAALTWDDPAMTALIEQAVPHPQDRLDFAALNDPLGSSVTPGTVEERVRRVIDDDRRRRRDPAFSADLGAFYGLLIGFGQVARVAASPTFSARSLVEDVYGWWYSFFSYFASGPPPERLDQLVALHEAGVVRFVGPGMWVDVDESRGLFRAGNDVDTTVVTARTLVEAQIAAPSVTRSRSPLVRALRERGALQDQLVRDDGFAVHTGKLLVDRTHRVVDTHGRAHPSRFALGITTSRPAAGTFARPHTNALSFRQNDSVARAILTQLAGADAHGADTTERPRP